MNESTLIDEGSPTIVAPSKLTRPIQVTEAEAAEFCLALESYKQASGRMFPTWSEILEVLKGMGYAKRIWTPVEAWSPISTGVYESTVGGDQNPVMSGWYARVETPLGP